MSTPLTLGLLLLLTHSKDCLNCTQWSNRPRSHCVRSPVMTALWMAVKKSYYFARMGVLVLVMDLLFWRTFIIHNSRGLQKASEAL